MNRTTTTTFCSRMTLIGLLLIIAACGDNPEKELACDRASAGFFPVINGIACLWGASDATTLKPSGSGTTGFTVDSPSLGYPIGEYEPNGLLDNANPLVINDSAVAITGNLGLENDTSDTFVFTPTQTGDYLVYLCSDSCEQPLENDTLSLMVLDQSQTTMAGTVWGTVSEKILSVRLNAGSAYYTEVQTMGAAESYHLVIVAN